MRIKLTVRGHLYICYSNADGSHLSRIVILFPKRNAKSKLRYQGLRDEMTVVTTWVTYGRHFIADRKIKHVDFLTT